MEFSRALEVGLKEKYFCFSGRASRSEHNYFMLFGVLVGVAEILLGLFLSPIMSGFLSLVVFFGLICPQMGMLVRRLHDMNYSGWWWLAPLGIFFALLIVSLLAFLLGGLNFFWIAMVVGLICFVITELWLLIVVIFKKGTEGENRFGPVPE